MPPASAVRLPLLVDSYLREQRSTTPVERFAELHATNVLAGRDRFEDRVPLESPRAGAQLAFQVDLDACTACQACVTACHSLNGLDSAEAETWRAVGLLQGGTTESPFQQPVTTACHHCLDPACMRGCPVNAYEKDATTGIVRHLDDQCIGCRYCMLMCPYEVPQYNRRLGIVRKCDMCAGRLSLGEAPACVEACPNEAISIRIVETAAVIEETQAGGFLPGTASPSITFPTTRYVSQRAMPKNLLPADFYRVRPSNGHFPLALMLVLTQWSVGMFLADLALCDLMTSESGAKVHASRGLLAVFVGLVALAASVLHLGRPKLAMRALVGLRTSWLSREILMFGLFACLALAYAALVTWPGLFALGRAAAIARPLAALVVATGTGGILCSALLYGATRRQFWSLARTTFRFGTTVVLTGLSSGLAMLLAENARDAVRTDPVARRLCFMLVAAAVVKLGWELGIFVHLRSQQLGELKRTAVLLRGELRGLVAARWALAWFGAIVVPLVVVAALGGASSVAPALVAVTILGAVVVVGGELVERTLFFRAVSVPSMPGGISR